MKMYDGDGTENPENEKRMKPRKNSRFGCPPLTPSTKIEADCFPVFENTEDKPDLP